MGELPVLFALLRRAALFAPTTDPITVTLHRKSSKSHLYKRKIVILSFEVRIWRGEKELLSQNWKQLRRYFLSKSCLSCSGVTDVNCISKWLKGKFIHTVMDRFPHFSSVPTVARRGWLPHSFLIRFGRPTPTWPEHHTTTNTLIITFVILLRPSGKDEVTIGMGSSKEVSSPSTTGMEVKLNFHHKVFGPDM